jgi:putative peptidoglycan lipid II flippase
MFFLKNKILSVVFIITLVNLFGKGLGFIREMFIAKQYGATAQTDIFYLAVSVPEIIYVAFGLAITSGFVPIYLKWKNEKSEIDAKNLYRSVSTVLFIICSIIVGVLYLAAPLVARLFAPGFDDEQISDLVKMMYILIPSLYFYIYSGLAIGILNAEKRFILPALTSVVHNVSMILAIVFLTDKFGLYGLAIGFSFGVFFQFLLQVPPVFSKGIQPTRHFMKYEVEIKKVFKDLTPIIITSFIVQINLFFDRFVASFLTDGSISALNYATKIIYLPISIFVFSLITIFYTNLVESAQSDINVFHKRLKKYLFILTSSLIPMALIMMAFPEFIVRTLYGRGAFDEEAIALTSSVLFWYALAFIFINLKDFMMKSTMAASHNKAIVWLTLLGVVLNVILSFLLGPAMGPEGIALASAIAMGIQTLANYIYLRKIVK